MASPTVAIFSALSSGIEMPNSNTDAKEQIFIHIYKCFIEKSTSYCTLYRILCNFNACFVENGCNL